METEVLLTLLVLAGAVILPSLLSASSIAPGRRSRPVRMLSCTPDPFPCQGEDAAA
jgi:hypothetical protein